MELAGALPVVCPHTGPARRVATARVARYCVGCYPPREIVIATSTPPRNTIASSLWCKSGYLKQKDGVIHRDRS